jgi:hypothetical protein
MATLPTRAEMEAYVREGARRRAMDPDFWAKVVEGESGWNPRARARTSREDSGGLLQLNTKNGLGVEALRRGINPHDPTQWKQQVDFGLDEGKKSHRPWTVARQLKGERTPGIPINPVARGSSKPAVAPSTAALPNSPLPDVGPPPTPPVDPYKLILDAAKERQDKQEKEQLVQAAAAAAPQPAPPAPAPVAPPPPPVDYAGLLLPRIKRGLLADDYSSGLLGAG